MTDREKIAAVEERIMAAFAAGHADAIAAQYTEDALLMPPDGPAVQGREAIAGMYRGFLQDFSSRLEARIEEMEVTGDQAWLRGRFEQSLQRKSDGFSAVARGKYLVIARRGGDGEWRFDRDIFNFDEPLPALPE